MIRYIATILLVVFLSAKISSASDDKTLHFGLSAVFGAGSETCLYHQTELKPAKRIFLSTILGSIPGLIKEIADSTKEDNRFSKSDITADITGAFTGAAISCIINNSLRLFLDEYRNC